MSYEEIRTALQAEAGKESGAGVSSDDVRHAERELGVSFPNSFRAFLQDFGWIAIGHWEVFGLGTDVPPYLDLVRMTRSERDEAILRLPTHLVPIMNDGGGNLHCLDTANLLDGECPVVFWDHDLTETQSRAQIAANFPDWVNGQLGELH